MEKIDQKTGADPKLPDGDKSPVVTGAPCEPSVSGLAASYEKSMAVVNKLKFDPRWGVRRVDSFLDWMRAVITPERFETISAWLAKFGHVAIGAAQVLSVIACLIAAIELKSWGYVACAIGLPLILVVLQYTADRFLFAGSQLIAASPSRLGSSAFLNCIAIALEAAGIVVLALYVIEANSGPEWQWSPLLMGVVILVMCDAAAHLALQPSILNITVSNEVTAGEEAIGIISFVVKTAVKLVPFLFGAGCILGAVALAWSLIPLIKNESTSEAELALAALGTATCLPLMAYLVFAFYHLMLDLMRAVLAVPGKLDALRRN